MRLVFTWLRRKLANVRGGRSATALNHSDGNTLYASNSNGRYSMIYDDLNRVTVVEGLSESRGVQIAKEAAMVQNACQALQLGFHDLLSRYGFEITWRDQFEAWVHSQNCRITIGFERDGYTIEDTTIADSRTSQEYRLLYVMLLRCPTAYSGKGGPQADTQKSSFDKLCMNCEDIQSLLVTWCQDLLSNLVIMCCGNIKILCRTRLNLTPGMWVLLKKKLFPDCLLRKWDERDPFSRRQFHGYGSLSKTPARSSV
jgi:hypothetical protein